MNTPPGNSTGAALDREAPETEAKTEQGNSEAERTGGQR